MFTLLTIITLCALIYFLAQRVARKRRGGEGAARQVTGLDAWIASEVAGIVARKLALSREDVAKSMRGNPDAEIVTSVERVVSRIEVVYERLAAGQIEARAEVRFEDGTLQRSTKMLGWSELPDTVREELTRTGAAQVTRGWSLPWSN